MAIHTVTGTIKAGSQGVTLMHEHIFMDLRKKHAGTQIDQKDDLVTLEMVDMLRQNHRMLKDNLFLDDKKIALEEVGKFKLHGGGTIVDMSNRGMGGQPTALKYLAESSGVNIVASAGFYTDATYPSYVKRMSTKELAQEIIHDISEGIKDSGVYAGIIGEIGTSACITDTEWRVLEAAAIAQRTTGAAISVHIDPWKPNGIEVVTFLKKCGADLTRVIVGHVDAVLDLDYCRRLLQMGCVIELDNFAKNYTTPGLHFDSDEQRIETLMVLIEEGYTSQLLISTDVCLKTDLYCYGGGGYSYIPQIIIPKLKKAGLSERIIRLITVQTPARLLDF